MSFKIRFCVALACTALSVAAVQIQAADEWHFVVSNKTSSKIVKLQVSKDKPEWRDFDVGSGIERGKSETMVWDHSTGNEGCEQWMRAKFADGSTGEPSKQDFCQNLDDPIEFGEQFCRESPIGCAPPRGWQLDS